MQFVLLLGIKKSSNSTKNYKDIIKLLLTLMVDYGALGNYIKYKLYYKLFISYNIIVSLTHSSLNRLCGITSLVSLVTSSL